MIEVKNLSKSLGNKKILQNINLKVNKGSIFGLIGENGVGKTTLIKCLTGIYKPDEGDIKINNQEVFENVEVKKYVGYVSDENQYYTSFKISELVKFYKLSYETFSYDRFKEINEIFKIPENKRIRQFSKGMKMRVALMLNLSFYPKVLILDEPTSGLDPIITRKLMNLLIEEVSERKTTVFISSHHIMNLEKICESIAIMEEGTVRYLDSLDSMKNNIKKLQTLFKYTRVLEEIKSWDEVMKIERVGKITYIITKDYSEKLKKRLLDKGSEFVEEVELSLEDMFIHCVEEEDGNEKNIEKTFDL
ncbi:ABC transporter ATP-binding protein [Clostridium oceanicum]|uniref:ABC transporter ATP-binding protein n=1 Tax=Clostridium oceanicum TaxID=1543 RepID=A0ABN1JU78_9CLOT